MPWFQPREYTYKVNKKNNKNEWHKKPKVYRCTTEYLCYYICNAYSKEYACNWIIFFFCFIFFFGMNVFCFCYLLQVFVFRSNFSLKSIFVFNKELFFLSRMFIFCWCYCFQFFMWEFLYYIVPILQHFPLCWLNELKELDPGFFGEFCKFSCLCREKS